jgi:capsule polysaccharide export protein KpsE/RkpR
MKKLVLLIVVVVGVWLGVNYIKTGDLSFFPKAVSAEEKQMRDLEKELEGVNAQIAQAGRAAGMTGMDTTADVSALMARKDSLEKQIAEARKKLLK